MFPSETLEVASPGRTPNIRASITGLETTMPKKAQAIPKGYHSVTPSLVIGGAAKAIDFYKKAFGAEELSRFPGPDGRIIHAEIKIGDSKLMLGDEMPEQGYLGPKGRGGASVSFFIYRENVDEAWKQALNAGGKTVMPLENQFWGDRAGCLEDPFGHQWWLAQHIEDLTPEELKRNAEAFFSQAQTAS
jgi:PhnB protein